MICKECPYYGVVDIDDKDNLVWSCTRKECIQFGDDYARHFGFETAQDMCEVKYKIRF